MAPSTTTTISDFVRQHGITMTTTRIDGRPDQFAGEMGPGARHWRCVLKTDGRRMTVYFSQGSAHTNPPTAEDVLDCLASDSAGYDNAVDSFDWANEYGFGSDSLTALHIYQKCGRQAARLQRFLRIYDDYETLLYETERQ